jgi:hypothetical protein
MLSKNIWKCFGILILIFVNSNAPADTVDNPCAGLLNLVDRPSQLDSACAVPFKSAVVEFGYQYQQLTHSAGQQQNFPTAEFRLGLPASNELAVLLPNYTPQSQAPRYGVTAPSFTIKHEIGYNKNWLGAVEAAVTLPSGSSGFGSNGVGTTVNGIVGYTINPQYNLTFSLGVSSLTEPSFSGGQRYTSVNPDIVITYSPSERINIYGEVYGQTRTGPGQGSGFNADGGVLFLILPKWEVDLEIGRGWV